MSAKVWDWTRCYFEPGDRVHVYHRFAGSPSDQSGRVVRVKTNRYGRVSYEVRLRGGSVHSLLLEELVHPTVRLLGR